MYPLNECAHWLLLVPLGHPPMIKGLAPPFVKVTSHEAVVPACVPLMKNVAVPVSYTHLTLPTIYSV